MEFKDYYKILGVDPKADDKTIKAAYRRLARQYHPDKNSEKGAEDKFKEVAEAYQVLKNEKTRADFDDLRQYGSQSHQGFQPPPGWKASHSSGFSGGSESNGEYSDFFNSIFGGRRQSHGASGFSQAPRRVRGQDIEVELPVSLEETLTDNQKTVEFKLPATESSHAAPSKKHLKVKIPKGVADGAKIRLKGQGGSGQNGGVAGDLYLLIRLKTHPLFNVSGDNISISVPLAPWEAALGIKVVVPTLDGKINLSIPPNTQSGDKLRVKGRGLTNKTARGDLHVIVKIVMPPVVSEKAKQLWQEFSEAEDFKPRESWGA